MGNFWEWLGASDSALSLLSHFGVLGRATVPWLAPLLGRLQLEVTAQAPVMFNGEKPPYDMLRVLVCNHGRRDAEQTRCEVRWGRSGKVFTAHSDTTGAWFNTMATDMASFKNPPEEIRTLSSNGHPECLGLLVKYPGQPNAYLITRSNFIATTQKGGPRWIHPGFVLEPGAYEVRLQFTSVGQATGKVVINVWNDGIHGGLRADLHPLDTIS